MPTFSQVDQTGDWLSSLYRCLSWNDRIEQKAMQPSVSLDAVEEETEQETVGSNHTEPR
jgi:hypothetical protein